MEMSKHIQVGMPSECLRELLESKIWSDFAHVQIAIDNDTPIGYSVTFDEKFEGKPIGFLYSGYARDRQATDAMFDEIYSWLRERGIDEIYGTTLRSPKAIKRRFDFDIAYYVMKRRVPNGR
jgi:hypothetical protein